MAAGAASQTATTQSLREQGLDGTPLNGTVVIDNHCHIGPAPHFYQTYNDAEGMVRTMDRVGMDQACIFSSMAILLDMREGQRHQLWKPPGSFPTGSWPTACRTPTRRTW